MENKLLATVDGREVRESDLQSLLQNLGQNAAQFAGPEGKKQLLNEIISQELLYSEALETNLEEEEAFTTVLEQMKKSLLIQYAANKLISAVTVGDDDVKSYFENNKDIFKPEATVNAKHILVDSLEKANEILEEINNGLDFSDAASKYSSCPSKDSGGALGEFSRGRMVPEFEEAAFNMEVGEVSQPVQTQFGYHLIKVDAINNPQDISFDEVKDQVRQQCLVTKQNEAYMQKQGDLKKKYDVNIVE